MRIVDTRIVGRFTEAEMKWNQHAKIRGPRQCEIEAVKRATAMEKHQRLVPPRRQHHRFDAINRQRLTSETVRGPVAQM
ncbi:MAG: hypothetical protein ACREQN_06680 [Candidatus Binataceae bacterium]